MHASRRSAAASIGAVCVGVGGVVTTLTALSTRRPRAYAEGLIGSIRRECFDHIVVFGERIEPRIGLEIEGPHGMRILERAGTNGGLAVSDVWTKRRQDREDRGEGAKSTFREHRNSPFNAWV